jgi:hypothetical protein
MWSIRVLMVILFILTFAQGREARAFVSLMDGRLMLNGSIDTFWIVRTHIPGRETEWHNSNVGMLLNTFRIEPTFTLVQKNDLTINIQSIFRYYYEAMTDLDREMHGALSPGNRNQYQFPTYRHDDPVNELFVDVVKGPWNFRVGKQIITWGETELKRTTDVINPMDLRYSFPGISPFEDLKIGLWMLRTFYKTELPGDLLFETIFIPGDHQLMRLPVEGTNWGSGLWNERFPSSIANKWFTWLQDNWKHDAPHRLRNIKYYQWGMRVRGAIKGVDWTLQYFDAVDFIPVGIPDRVNAQAAQHFTGKGDERLFDKIFDYRRTKYLGGSFQWYEEYLVKGIVRGEVSYQIGKHYNTYDPASGIDMVITGIEHKDAVGYGFAIDRAILWPWLMKYNDARKLDLTFQVFQDWILKHERDLVISGRGKGDRNTTSLTIQLMTYWFKQELTTVWKSLYDTSGYGYNVLSVVYGPGQHWRYEAGSMFFYSYTSWHPSSREFNSVDKDCFYFRLKYQW